MVPSLGKGCSGEAASSPHPRTIRRAPPTRCRDSDEDPVGITGAPPVGRSPTPRRRSRAVRNLPTPPAARLPLTAPDLPPIFLRVSAGGGSPAAAAQRLKPRLEPREASPTAS